MTMKRRESARQKEIGKPEPRAKGSSSVSSICNRSPLLIQMFRNVASSPQTIGDLNVLPDSLISSAEVAEECVAKFTSLVRARD